MKSTTEESQRRAARLAGLMYLLTIAIWAFAFFARAGLVVYDNAAETVSNIVTNERLFRISLASDLVLGAGVVVLIVALWALLKPVDRHIALLAAVWRLVDPLLGFMTLSSFSALLLSNGAEYLNALEAPQLEALAMLAIELYGVGFTVSPIFLGLGSAAFSYLLFKSRYVPRALAGFGVFSSLVAVVFALMTIVFPDFATVAAGGLVPLLLYEIALGAWLLFKGVHIQANPGHAT